MFNILPFGGNFSPIWENQNQKKKNPSSLFCNNFLKKIYSLIYSLIP